MLMLGRMSYINQPVKVLHLKQHSVYTAYIKDLNQCGACAQICITVVLKCEKLWQVEAAAATVSDRKVMDS